MSMLSTVYMFFLLTILAVAVNGSLFGSSATTSGSSYASTSAINIQYGSNYGGYGASPGGSDEFQPGNPGAKDRSASLMDKFYIPLSLGQTAMDACSETSTETSSTVDVVDSMKFKLACLMRRAFPDLMWQHHHNIEDLIQPIQEDLISYHVNPNPLGNYNTPAQSSEWQVNDLMNQDKAKSFKLIPAAVTGDAEIYITDVSNIKSCYTRTPENGQITKFGSTSIDFDTMAYFWLKDHADNNKLKLYLMDGSGRIETLVESKMNIHPRSWKILSDGFEVPENQNQLQFFLDMNEKDTLSSTSDLMFWIYDSSEIYATVTTDSNIQVFVYDWNEKAWTFQTSEEFNIYS